MYSSLFVLPHMFDFAIKQSPTLSTRILTCFPFDLMEYEYAQCINIPRSEPSFERILGLTDPCPNAVHMEPFSTSVFKVLI
jgi:hypothetical protein